MWHNLVKYQSSRNIEKTTSLCALPFENLSSYLLYFIFCQDSPYRRKVETPLRDKPLSELPGGKYMIHVLSSITLIITLFYHFYHNIYVYHLSDQVVLITLLTTATVGKVFQLGTMLSSVSFTDCKYYYIFKFLFLETWLCSWQSIPYLCQPFYSGVFYELPPLLD